MFLDEKLFELRKACDLSQEELARRADVSARTIWRLEHGMYSRPHRGTLERIAAALGESADFFLPWTMSRPAPRSWHRPKVMA